MEKFVSNLNENNNESLNNLSKIVTDIIESRNYFVEKDFQIKIGCTPVNEQLSFYRKELNKTQKKLLKFEYPLKEAINGSIRYFRNYYKFCVEGEECSEKIFNEYVNFPSIWIENFVRNFAFSLYDDNDDLPYLEFDYSNSLEEIDETLFDLEENPQQYIPLPYFKELIECINSLNYLFMIFDFYHLALNQKESNSIFNRTYLNPRLEAFKSNFNKNELKKIHEKLKNEFIPGDINFDYFIVLFEDEKLRSLRGFRRIKWLGSIPLFCCLLFGFENIEYQNKNITFSGIIDKNKDEKFYKKATLFFTFGSRKVTNKTLSEKSSKLAYCKAPKDFNKLYSVIKTVQGSTF